MLDVPCISGLVHELTHKFTTVIAADVPNTAIGIVLVYQGSRPGDLIKVNAVQHEFGLTYYSISFALNVILTLMIVGRLLLLNRRIRKAMNAPVKVSGLYKTIVTTLVESYALYSVALLLFIGSFSAGDPIAGVFFPTLVEVEVRAILHFLDAPCS